MIVRVHRNYDFPNFYRQSPKGEGIWQGVQFTTEPIKKCDYFIALNPPNQLIEVAVPQGNKWLFLQEPPILEYQWHCKSFNDFDRVFGFWSNQEFPNLQSTQTALPWHVSKNFEELVTLAPTKKWDKVSWITSNQRSRSGQKSRMEFLTYLKRKKFAIDLFGRGFQPIDDKFSGLFPYKYSIAVENHFCPHYWTEKIADCFLSWTMPIYAGATNIEQYFPTEAMILIDPNRPAEALKIISKAVAEDRWGKNIKALEKARNQVLQNYQFFPWISQKIKQHNRISAASEKIKIPANLPPKRTLLAKLKTLAFGN